MPKKLVLLAVLVALIAGACGGGDDASTPSPAAAPDATEAPAPTEAPDADGSQSSEDDASTASTDPMDGEAPASELPVIDGPAAPEFVLTLGTGDGEYRLADAQKPVYMVFWAEW